jgi:hypothetical protein
MSIGLFLGIKQNTMHKLINTDGSGAHVNAYTDLSSSTCPYIRD